MSVRLEPVSRVDQVTSAIRVAILSGELEPGMPFKVNELAANLGVSIIPVREALQRLAAVGLIDLRHARTARVSPLSASDLKDIYTIRGLLEGDAAERSCAKWTDGDLEQMAESLERMVGLEPTSEAFWSVHQNFHRLLIAPALTPRLQNALGPLHEGTERYVRLIYDEIGFERRGHPEQVHRPILRAAQARDTERVCVALREHYEGNLRWMLAGLASSPLLTEMGP